MLDFCQYVFFLLSCTGANVRSRNLQGMKCIPIHLPSSSSLFILCVACCRTMGEHEVMRRSCKPSVCIMFTSSQHKNISQMRHFNKPPPVTKEKSCGLHIVENALSPRVGRLNPHGEVKTPIRSGT